MSPDNANLYPKLFEAGHIGTLTIPNRIVMPAMVTCLADGRYVSQRLTDYLDARARGGTGLIIQEFATVDPQGPIVPNQVGIYDDDCIPGLKRLVDTIHSHGAKIALQIGHGGHRVWSKYINSQPVSASDVQGRGGEKPRPLTLDEIKRLIASFVSAAERVKKAGFDGVEIHCAHGYLIRQFLSPYTNKRKDQYGGDLTGRSRLALEVISGVRQSVGSFPMWARINADDFVEKDGFSFEESKTVCHWMKKAGVDAISVSGSTYESTVNWGLAPMFVPRGFLLPYAAEIRKLVGLPTIAVGRIDTPEFAEQVLEGGKADFIAMGRSLIADPEFANKARTGRSNEIRHCIADNVCIDSLSPETRLHCTVNPEVGKEKEYEIVPATKIKKVLIVGGGPAGMEVARVCALRKHQVVLCEKQGTLGGQINIASKGSHKEDLNCITSFLSGQLNKLGVEIKLNTPVTNALVESIKPDVVIVAAGSDPLIPPIPGLKNDSLTAREVLLKQKILKGKIIIIGGGRIGIEVAEVIKNKDNDVTIIEMLGKIGGDLGESIRFPTINRLKEIGVNIMVSTQVEAIEGSKVTIKNNGRVEHLEADTIVLAVGARSNNDAFEMIKGNVEKHRIGDCKKPRNILEAIAEGSELGRQI